MNSPEFYQDLKSKKTKDKVYLNQAKIKDYTVILGDKFGKLINYQAENSY